MITWSSTAEVNEFLIYKLFIKEYSEVTAFSIMQNDTETPVTISYLMEYPSSLRLLLETDITKLYGNDYKLIAKNDDVIIYKEKLTIN